MRLAPEIRQRRVRSESVPLERSRPARATLGERKSASCAPRETRVDSRTAFLGAYRELVSPEMVWATARRLGVVTRRRKLDVPVLVESSVLALSGLPGTRTSVHASYVQLSGSMISHSAFYERFNRPFAELMHQIAVRAHLAVRHADVASAADGELAALVQIGFGPATDAALRVLRRLAPHWAPPDGATAEHHRGFRLSVIVAHREDPGALHEGAPRVLLLGEVASVGEERLRQLLCSGAEVLMEHDWSLSPVVVRVHLGRGERRTCRGRRLECLLKDGMLASHNGVVDVDVSIDMGQVSTPRERRVRVVGVCDSDTEHVFRLYLTTVPRAILRPYEVAMAHLARHEIALLWRNLSPGGGLAAIRGWREEAVPFLIHARTAAIALNRLLGLSAPPRRGKGSIPGGVQQ